ncbi:MAG: hypothetical protein ACYC96_06270 [Fimbriimonadaceae bacterium]
MSLEPLPPNLEQGVQRFAAEQHISHAEALRKLIQTGLTVAQTAPKGPVAQGRPKKSHGPSNERGPAGDIGPFKDGPGAIQALDEELAARHGHVRRGPRGPRSTENPEAIFGLFAGDESFRKAIDDVIARRATRYGTPE